MFDFCNLLIFEKGIFFAPFELLRSLFLLRRKRENVKKHPKGIKVKSSAEPKKRSQRGEHHHRKILQYIT